MTDIQSIAQIYIDKGYAVVPLVKGEKRANMKWQSTTYVAAQFAPDNGIAIKCGAPSSWLVDVDLDSLEAVEAAKHLLPHTGLVHGRPGKPESHYWFVSDGTKTTQFSDVAKGGMLVEIRSTGGYTAVPPSGHPSGDVLAWVSDRAPMTIDADALYQSVRDVAICALLVRHWPGPGRTHVAIGPLAGFLLSAGVAPAQVKRVIVTAATIAKADVPDVSNYVDSTIAKHGKADKVTGGPTLAKELSADVVDRMRRWLKCLDENAVILDAHDPMPSAHRFIGDHHTSEGVTTLRHQGGAFFAYDRGLYNEQEEARVRAELYRFLEPTKVTTKDGTLAPFKPTKSKVENVLDALRAVSNLPASFAPPCWLSANDLNAFDLLPCCNGLLHLPTRQLHPLSPQFFSVNGLDFDYDASPTQPTKWLAFMHSIWPNDQESIDTLQEIFGYALTVDTGYQKIFLIVGPKRSGKGTIARVLRQLVGDRNTCNPTLASFGRDFGKQALIGKTLAVISDARISAKTDVASVAETLLSISGEDAQTISRKYLPDWNGQLRVRFLVLTNELPRINDISGALSSRFIVLTMTESFFGKEDLGLMDRLSAEVPSILNWALDGRDRLFRRGYFTQPQSAQATVQQLDDLGSPIKTFVRDSCNVAPGLEIKKKDLFSAWQTWCNYNNVMNVGTTQTFGRDLRAALPQLTDGQRRPELHWFWKGIGAKPNLPSSSVVPPF